jgi:hypothetical protein
MSLAGTMATGLGLQYLATSSRPLLPLEAGMVLVAKQENKPLTDFDRAVQAAIDTEFEPGATPAAAQIERIRHMVEAAITALTQAAAERAARR